MTMHAGGLGNATSVAQSSFPLQGPSGSAAAPTYSLRDGTYGLYSEGAPTVDLSVAGSRKHAFSTNAYFILDNAATIQLGASSDAILARDTAAVLAVKNADTAQTLRIYGANTGTKYLSLTHNATNAVISVTTGSIVFTTADDSTGAAVVAHTVTDTITGGVTDGYCGSLRITPTYSAGTAQTVTRHNYIDVNSPTLSGAGPAAVTDACVFRFNAAAGTHKAVDGNTTKSTPGTVNAWLKCNVNGTVYFTPMYTSKTS